MSDLSFKGLSKFDIDLIKSIAKERYLAATDLTPPEALIEVVFECIHAKGMNIVKDDAREATWSKLTSKHYNYSYRPNLGWW